MNARLALEMRVVVPLATSTQIGIFQVVIAFVLMVSMILVLWTVEVLLSPNLACYNTC